MMKFYAEVFDYTVQFTTLVPFSNAIMGSGGVFTPRIYDALKNVFASNNEMTKHDCNIWENCFENVPCTK
mgnify:CR=1 FL=1